MTKQDFLVSLSEAIHTLVTGENPTYDFTYNIYDTDNEDSLDALLVFFKDNYSNLKNGKFYINNDNLYLEKNNLYDGDIEMDLKVLDLDDVIEIEGNSYGDIYFTYTNLYQAIYSDIGNLFEKAYNVVEKYADVDYESPGYYIYKGFDVSGEKILLSEMKKIGFSEKDLKKLLDGNALQNIETDILEHMLFNFNTKQLRKMLPSLNSFMELVDNYTF